MISTVKIRAPTAPPSPTREGSYRLWKFPVSALAFVLAGTYTLRATSGNVDHPYRQAPEVDYFLLIPLSRSAYLYPGNLHVPPVKWVATHGQHVRVICCP
ncbi:hypothetical protein AVEN_262914-1 [Araneus ventricosus]|uniref:Uncharacterized protein n=1 Tax=Araneus ventricosus TaxID=182803 RepID=A0A4Y2DHY3_ARAVE|nr:hypothetical protein AVEN_262914-1 [Araneus ventricosus]